MSDDSTLDLFKQPPPSVDRETFYDRPHAKVDTSEAAAESMVGHADTQRMRVYRVIADRGEEGMTMDECAVLLNLNLHSLCPRFWELERRGLVYKSPAKRLTRANRNARVYRVTDAR